MFGPCSIRSLYGSSEPVSVHVLCDPSRLTTLDIFPKPRNWRTYSGPENTADFAAAAVVASSVNCGRIPLVVDARARNAQSNDKLESALAC